MAIPSVVVYETLMDPGRRKRKTMAGLLISHEVLVGYEALAFDCSLDVQLRFLKCVLKDFMLVPIAIGQWDYANVLELVEQVWVGNETWVIVSADLSRFQSVARASRHDRRTLKQIMRMSATIDPVDARGAIALNGVLRAAAARGLQSEILAVTHLGKTTRDSKRVGGYGAVALW